MRTNKDIYDYDIRYERSKTQIDNSNISAHNKKLILEFDKTCSIEHLTKARKIKIIQSLIIFADSYLKKDYDRATKDVTDALRKADIKDFCFHDLRHTFASHLAMSGANINVIQQLLGHKSIKMTLRYSHLSQEHLQGAVNKLNLWKGK